MFKQLATTTGMICTAITFVR